MEKYVQISWIQRPQKSDISYKITTTESVCVSRPKETFQKTQNYWQEKISKLFNQFEWKISKHTSSSSGEGTQKRYRIKKEKNFVRSQNARRINLDNDLYDSSGLRGELKERFLGGCEKDETNLS